MNDHLPKESRWSPPTEGPWYLIYLRPEWRLVAAPYSKQESSTGHYDLWEDRVIPLLARHYRIPQSTDLMRLANAPYGYPRGRVSISGNTIAVHHGQDWPKDLSTDWVKQTIENRFHLENLPDLQWSCDERFALQSAHSHVLYTLRLLP